MRGMHPGLKDDAHLWAHWRQEVDGDRRNIALLGTSRFLWGLDPEQLSAELGEGHEAMMLGINGSSALPVLEHLVDDPEFCGVALVEVYPSALFLEDTGRRWAARSFLRFYDERSFVEPLEGGLQRGMLRTFVFTRPEFRIPDFIRYVRREGELPGRVDRVVHFSRHQSVDFSERPLHGPGSLEARWRVEPALMLDDAALEARLTHFAELRERLRARGGEVVFFRMLSSGAIREREAESLPRARYYDRLVARTGAPALHFEDVPALAAFEAADGAHLDHDDVEGFTHALVDALKERDILPRRLSGATGCTP